MDKQAEGAISSGGVRRDPSEGIACDALSGILSSPAPAV